MLRLNGLHIKFEVAPSPVSTVHVISAVCVTSAVPCHLRRSVSPPPFRVTSAVCVNSAVRPLSAHYLLPLRCGLTISELILLEIIPSNK